MSHAYAHIALEHSSPERVEATFCSAGRTGRIGLLVMGRLRSLGCVMLIEIFVFFSRSWRAISMRPCHPVHCTRRAAKGLRDINGRLAAERRQKGREACMRGSERAVRTPWRQERRQRYAQERRHLSSAMRHRWGRALTRARSEHPGGLHRPQKGPGGEAHRNPSLFVRSWPLGAGAVRWPCHGHGPGRKAGLPGVPGQN